MAKVKGGSALSYIGISAFNFLVFALSCGLLLQKENQAGKERQPSYLYHSCVRKNEGGLPMDHPAIEIARFLSIGPLIVENIDEIDAGELSKEAVIAARNRGEPHAQRSIVNGSGKKPIKSKNTSVKRKAGTQLGSRLDYPL